MLRILLTFALIGPILGSFALTAAGFSTVSATAMQGASTAESVGIRIFGSIFFGIWGLVLAIPIGLIPACAAGISYWLILKFLTRTNPQWPVRLIVGAILGLTISSCFGYWLGAGKGGTFFSWFFSWPGTVASALCALATTQPSYCKAFPERYPLET